MTLSDKRHFNFYRYVRMMLRRYPVMRLEWFATFSGPGIAGICEKRMVETRIRRYLGIAE